ncbi:hypothetical protein ACFY5D_03570 [Paeniglutamicibacter sp. NPDC012692]|uniref:hypothetical protein n=1 Tax=Paeniglutamicibacter sp. NPDC012692 TaxID=3364388 RepID=UPI0036CE2000
MTETAKDKRPYFVLTNEYPRHRKVRGLSDKAFRLHITLLGICNEDLNDGIIGKHDLNMLGPGPGKELLTAKLVYDNGGGTYRMHDYVKHQNTAAEVKHMLSERAESGRRGGIKSAHTRNHVNKGVTDPNCPLCPGEEPPPED